MKAERASHKTLAEEHSDEAKIRPMEAGDKGLHAKVQQLEDEIQRLKEGERLRSELLHESAVQEYDILDQVSLGETVREMERESDRRILSSLQAECHPSFLV